MLEYVLMAVVVIACVILAGEFTLRIALNQNPGLTRWEVFRCFVDLIDLRAVAPSR